jgi:hypothetical protein
MSSDTAQLLKEHVEAVKELLANEKPDRAPEKKKTKEGPQDEQ